MKYLLSALLLATTAQTFAICVNTSSNSCDGVSGQLAPNSSSIPMANLMWLNKASIPSGMGNNSIPFTITIHPFSLVDFYGFVGFDINFKLLANDNLEISLKSPSAQADFKLNFTANSVTGRYNNENASGSTLLSMLQQLNFSGALTAVYPKSFPSKIAPQATKMMAESISYNPSNDQFTIYIHHDCGATILDQTHLLTAAHCVTYYDDTSKALKNKNPSSLRISIGNSWQSPKQLYTAKDITVNQKYQLGDSRYDFAVITLAEPMNTNQKILLDKTASGISTNLSNLFVAGWGRNSGSQSSQPSYRLYDAPQTFMNFNNCKTALGSSYSYLFDSQYPIICAGGDTSSGATCKGDSGGPLFYAKDSSGNLLTNPSQWNSSTSYYQTGVDSFASTECSAKGPTVRASAYTICNSATDSSQASAFWNNNQNVINAIKNACD